MPAFTCLVHLVYWLRKHRLAGCMLTHVYPDAECVSRLHTAALGPAAALDSCVDALLLWGLALLSSVTVKSQACIQSSREG